MTRTVAAFDLGTNTVSMWIARSEGERVEVLADRSEITRLGRGVDATQRLSDDGVVATLAVLTKFAAEARELGAIVGAVATSAVRDAQNSASFLDAARAVLGADVDVIDGEREAALTYAGATHALPTTDALLVDVGGGSTELIRVSQGRIAFAVSLDVGSVRLTERHLRHDPAQPHELDALRADVDRALALAPRLRADRVVAIAGTATTLGAIARALPGDDLSLAHGLVLSRDELAGTVQALSLSDATTRAAIPSLAPRRADVIVAGGELLLRICERAECRSVLLSHGGVRVGLGLELLARS